MKQTNNKTKPQKKKKKKGLLELLEKTSGFMQRQEAHTVSVAGSVNPNRLPLKESSDMK